MVNLNLHKEIAQIFDENYNKIDLESNLRKPIRKFVKENLAFCEAQGVPENIVNLVLPNNLRKMKSAELAAIPFLNKAIFEAFRMYLQEDVRKIFDELIWKERLSNQEIEEKWKVIIYEKKTQRFSSSYARTTFSIKEEFKIFKYTGGNRYNYEKKANFVVALLPKLRKIVSRYYDTPQDAVFNPVAEIEKTDQTFSGEEAILLELPRIYAYQSQKQIKTSVKGRVLASTTGKMQRKLKLEEFYPETTQKILKSLRTSLLANLITVAKNKAIGTVAEQIHYLVQQDYRKRFNETMGLFPHLKGTGYVDFRYLRNIESIMYDTFRQLPLNEWIRFDNLENYFKYNFIEIKPISEWVARDKLHYVVEPDGGRYTFEQKMYIDQAQYYQAIILPFLKGTCFLFAAFGLLDIAYDTPDTSEFGTTAYSPFDGLKYIKLTKLGAYVTAKTDKYEAPAHIAKSTIRLSKDSLTVVIDEKDSTAPVILEPYAQRVSPNRFQTDFGYFLKGVANKKQLDDKISLFKHSVKVKMPENWEQFFKELGRKIDPLKKISNVKLFQIPADNPELLRLIAKDAKLQKLCLKAEGCHIIIKNSNYANFRKRLQEFGYLLA